MVYVGNDETQQGGVAIMKSMTAKGGLTQSMPISKMIITAPYFY